MRSRRTLLREGVLGAIAAVLLVLFLVEDVGGAQRAAGSRRGDVPEGPRPAHRLFELRSRGPDGRMGTADDVVWPGRPAK